jgi:hypothetical protein
MDINVQQLLGSIQAIDLPTELRKPPVQKQMSGIIPAPSESRKSKSEKSAAGDSVFQELQRSIIFNSEISSRAPASNPQDIKIAELQMLLKQKILSLDPEVIAKLNSALSPVIINNLGCRQIYLISK